MINESQGRRKHEAKIIFNGKENSGTVHGGNSVDWMYRMRKQKSHVRTITNVSYDPTREFYEAYNPLFEKYYKEKREKKWILFNPTEVPVHRHALLWKDAMLMSLHWHWSMISH